MSVQAVSKLPRIKGFSNNYHVDMKGQVIYDMNEWDELLRPLRKVKVIYQDGTGGYCLFGDIEQGKADPAVFVKHEQIFEETLQDEFCCVYQLCK